MCSALSDHIRLAYHIVHYQFDLSEFSFASLILSEPVTFYKSALTNIVSAIAFVVNWTTLKMEIILKR